MSELLEELKRNHVKALILAVKFGWTMANLGKTEKETLEQYEEKVLRDYRQ